jgi:hypothetical protein
MFASSSRLDLGITVGPQKPGHIKTILSGRLPIFMDYKCMSKDVTGSALWRMRAALKHQDRVRGEIAFEGTGAWFDEFFEATNCSFPVLESLLLRPKYGHEVELPDTFLGGPDLSYLHLRRLTLHNFPLSFISGILLSATALTSLNLRMITAFGPSPETSLLACLHGMPRLCSLYLSILFESTSQLSTPKYIVPLSKLTSFAYMGSSLSLGALVAGLSAPSLRDVFIDFHLKVRLPIVHLPRFISEIEEHCHAVRVTFGRRAFRRSFHISLLTQLEYTNHGEPHFNLDLIIGNSTELVMPLIAALSVKLTTVEELCVSFGKAGEDIWENFIPWRRFYQQFPGVKTLRTEGTNSSCIARTLLPDHEVSDDDLAFLPALEAVGLGKNPLLTDEGKRGPELAAFGPFVSARRQAGRPVKVSGS